MAVDRNKWPIWVRFCLWGVSGRAMAWACFFVALALTIGTGLYGIVDARFYLGTAFIVAAVGYYIAIRWVEKHGSWQ